MEKGCSTCRHRSKGIGEEPCYSCVFGDIRESNVAYSKWEPAHSCSTCKHCDKKITEEPCLDCNIRKRNDKWEARE